LAASKLARERPGQTLQPTALVHEAWLRLMGNNNHDWKDQRQFFLAAAEAMRRILIENARRKHCLKKGGQLQRVEGEPGDLPCPMPDDQLLAVDEALDRLAKSYPRAAEVVKLRFFAGLTQAQVADQLQVSASSVERAWSFARAWLFNEIRHDLGLSGGVKESRRE
jgi:RNA polymerase sigma factor (TIGR02999 family)